MSTHLHARPDCIQTNKTTLNDEQDEFQAIDDPNLNSCLLTLPPELREIIYAHALQEDGEIAVTKSLKQPGLLRTCTQLRRETKGMWYHLNKFSVDIGRLDAILVHAWSRHLYFINVRRGALSTRISRSPAWTNLMARARLVWSMECPFAQETYEDMTPTESVIAAMHEIAEDHMGRSWEKCELALEKLCAYMAGPRRLVRRVNLRKNFC
ncbi:hypothetical protein LTS10_008949 [Elasticomyces elasticus]|nr:hypothetical protein LTS10_008949 [Elasticomyces elasticus]